MPTISGPSVAEDDDPLVLSLTGRDGVARPYSIRPISADELWQVMALDRVYSAIYTQRMRDLIATDAASATVAAELFPEDPHLEDALRTLMDRGEMTARQAIYLPLGLDVAATMEADGCKASVMKVASVAATVWHFSGDMDAVTEVWTTGKLRPGNSAARPWMNSHRMGGDRGTPRAPTPRTTSPTTSNAA